MGIKSLLPFVKNACREGNILEFKGCSIAIDVSCLLHKGLFGSMEEFADGKDSKLYIYYVKKHVQALLDMGCHVIMVFDGRALPAKKSTNDERKKKRANNMRAGELLLSQGLKEEAVAKFQQAVTLTPEIIETTIEFFRKIPLVDIITAPYESDAQLTFLTKEGFADAVITEDSDLIAFGCEKIIFKWNVDKGDCTVYEQYLLPTCFTGEMRNNFDFRKFRRICILSGCDYLQNGLPGIGLTKAQKFFNKTCQTDLRALLPRIPSYLQDKNLKVTKEFIEEFIRAENTFLHQVVFDPKLRCQRPLTPYPLIQKMEEIVLLDCDDDDDFVPPLPNSQKSDSEYHYAGVVSSTTLSMRLALGNQTKDGHITDKFLLPQSIPEWSVWSDTFVSGGQKLARKAAEEHRKQTSCGAFKLDSPHKKKRKHIDEEDSDGPEEVIKSPPTKKVVARPKKLKNEPNIKETYDQLMEIYAPEKSRSKEKPSSKNSGENVDPQIEKVVIEVELFQDSLSSISEFSLPPGYITPAESPSQSQEGPKIVVAPAPIKSVSLPNPVKRKSLGLGRPVLVKSPYFTNKSSCSNPFKKVILDGPPSLSATPPAPKVEKQKSLLDAVDDDESKPSNSYLINRFSGFKAPGLRRSITK